LTLGYTASITGRLNVSSGRQDNGIQLWIDHLNEQGGFQVGDQMVTFETVSYDDESNSERVQELYTRLATEDEADFLISPYSSGLTSAAAVIAEQYGRVMITTGAASDSAYKLGYTGVYQTYTPASRYLTGAIDLLKATDSEATRVAFVHENDQFSTDVVTAAREYAEANGLEVVHFEGYDSETTDFGPFINKIEAAEPDALMGGGHFQDGSTFTRQLEETGTQLPFVALLVAPPEPDFAELGNAAVGIIGPSQWEPLAEFTEASAEEAGLEWFGPSGEDFVVDYEAKYDEEPSYHSAGGYAAGLILQKAIMDAGSWEADAVKEALDNMDILTFYGRIKFDTSAEAHGLQVGHSMIYVQWQDPDDLHKEVVWPAEGRTAEALYPIP
jgi:branched-chain amino acid transport system substrate-binding protein